MAGQARAIRLNRTGGPEVLEWEERALPAPGPGELLVRHHAIGVNFIDTYYRSGLYPVTLPSGLGAEAAGVVEMVGRDVTAFRPGDRVGSFTGKLGAYATRRIVQQDDLVRLPDTISFEQAAGSLLKGCTAEFLIERCARIAPGQTVLVHAAAGGVGSILVQWLKALGARVIAHGGSREKAERARGLGADHALCCPMAELAGEVRRLTDGKGVAVVLDGVGAASWSASVESLARRGLLVSYGNASGAVPPITLLDLSAAGSLFVTRPRLHDYCATPEEKRRSAARLFEQIASGAVEIAIGNRFPLAAAADAHRALESRSTTSSTILLPE